MSQPLDGIRILDLTRLLPGAIATMMMADMGADVVKVEDPNGGDYARWMPPLIDGLGAFFRGSNRDKRSIIIDLKQAAGQDVLHRLVQTADVVIEGFRPGVTERLRCDYATLKAINPRIVYASMSGWGQTGPYARVTGHDLNYVSLNGLQGANGTPQPLGGQIADVGGAYVAVMGIVAALLQRSRTGQGDYLDVALSESAIPFAMFSWVESYVTGVGGGEGSLTGGLAYYNVYTAGDGKPVALAALEPKFWANFCQAVDKPDWSERHSDLAGQAQLKVDIAALFATRPAEEWDQLLGPANCCFTLITPPADLHNDPHLQARGMIGINSDGAPWLRSPVRLGDDSFTPGLPPGYGEHTRAILSENGYGPDEVDDLVERGVVRQQAAG